ncbi:MAG: hypothetical protein V1894_03515 [Chloroflexota bacterium]
MMTENRLKPAGCDGALGHLRETVAQGKHWFIALLEAIGGCEATEDTYNERHYSFYIAGEAFDWLTMAERLILEAGELLPQDEVNALLFEEKLPLAVSTDEFKSLIGAKKYTQYLNYFYGITVEGALIQKVTQEVRKEQQARCLPGDFDAEGEAYLRLYGEDRLELLTQFRQIKSYPDTPKTTLFELKEFTYWLFKYRVRISEPAKIASDTQKALSQLRGRGFLEKPGHTRRRVIPIDVSP